MKKFLSLIKVTMSQNMDLFRINTKKNSKKSRLTMLIILSLVFFTAMFGYASTIIEMLISLKLEYILLTIFALFASLLTFIEGVYKSNELLFNCKDDDLLLSLPIKKSTVLFIRVFKFYLFELMYNTLFLAPAMIVYAIKVPVGASYYFVSLIALLLIPIIPIVTSCVIGAVTSFLSVNFKHRNIIQIVITMIFVTIVIGFSFNTQGMTNEIVANGEKINNIVGKVYYPIKAYVELSQNFNLLKAILFVLIHVVVFIAMIWTLGKVYFKLNSKTKVIIKTKTKADYMIKTKKQVTSLVIKEIKKFFSIPVFVINSGFGLVLFVVISTAISLNFNGLTQGIKEMEIPLSSEQITKYMPIIVYIIVSATIFMTSITSSMISLEGKAFNTLKSLPVSPLKIVISKVIAALIIMIPAMFVGDIILFVRFKLSLMQIILILFTTIFASFLNEMIGIIINLKYPKLNAKNDAEVVKQSMSSAVSVFIGMGIAMFTIGIVTFLIVSGLSQTISMLIMTSIYIVVLMVLVMYLKKRGTKLFNDVVE